MENHYRDFENNVLIYFDAYVSFFSKKTTPVLSDSRPLLIQEKLKEGPAG